MARCTQIVFYFVIIRTNFALVCNTSIFFLYLIRLKWYFLYLYLTKPKKYYLFEQQEYIRNTHTARTIGDLYYLPSEHTHPRITCAIEIKRTRTQCTTLRCAQLFLTAHCVRGCRSGREGEFNFLLTLCNQEQSLRLLYYSTTIGWVIFCSSGSVCGKCVLLMKIQFFFVLLVGLCACTWEGCVARYWNERKKSKGVDISTIGEKMYVIIK